MPTKKLTFLVFAACVLFCSETAKGGGIPSLNKSTCAIWSNYDDMYINFHADFWKTMGFRPQQTEITRWADSSNQNKTNYILGMINAFNEVYKMQDDAEFKFSYELDDYIVEIEKICENNIEKDIASVLLEANHILQKKHESNFR